MSNLKFKSFRILLKFASKEKVKYLLDFLVFGIGFFISSLLALIISILVNGNMSKEELGIYNFNKSVLEFSSYVFTLILYRSYLRFNIAGNNISLFKKVIKVNFVAFILLEFLAYYLTGSYLVLLFPLFIFYEERLYFFRSLMKVANVNFLKLGSALITLLFVAYLSYTKSVKPNNVLLAYGIGFLFSIFFYKKFKKKSINLEVIPWKTILLYSIPSVGLIVVRLSLDISSQYLIKSNFGLIELSKYAIATRVLLSVKIFSSLLMMFFPVIYFREIKKRNINFINKLRLTVIIVMMLIVFLAIFFKVQIYELMGASKYVEYTDIYSILALSELIFIIGGFWGIYLSFAIKTHVSLVIYFFGAILNIVILKIFLPRKGIYVAPISIMISNIFIAGLMFFLSFRMERKYLNETS